MHAYLYLQEVLFYEMCFGLFLLLASCLLASRFPAFLASGPTLGRLLNVSGERAACFLRLAISQIRACAMFPRPTRDV